MTDNGGGNNNGGNYNRGGNNTSGGNNNDGNNEHNGNGGGNNRSNSGNFGGNARRHGSFYYMTTARVVTTKFHDMHHVPNPIKPATMAHTDLDSCADTYFTGKNTTTFSYTGYE